MNSSIPTGDFSSRAEDPSESAQTETGNTFSMKSTNVIVTKSTMKEIWFGEKTSTW